MNDWRFLDGMLSRHASFATSFVGNLAEKDLETQSTTPPFCLPAY